MPVLVIVSQETAKWLDAGGSKSDDLSLPG
jgi:hypothetical protein